MLAKIWCLILGLTLVQILSAQVRYDRQAYQTALDSVVLLHNEDQTIPYGGLDTLRPVYLGFNFGDEDSTLLATLNKYLPVARADEPRADVTSRLGSEHNLLIVGINTGNWTATAGAELRRQLMNYDNADVALLVFGEGALWEEVDLRQLADVIIYAPRPGYWEQSLAAQRLFGGIAGRARLARALGPHFPAGSGRVSTGGIRLGYAPPAALGMDAQLLSDSISAIVRQAIDARAFPGVQVLIAKDGAVVYHEAFGKHTYEEDQPVRTTDIYDMASITKISASLPALMRLSGEGRFNLDAGLGDYLPYFDRGNKDDLTYRRLLTHSARLMAWIPFWRTTLRGNGRYPWSKRYDITRNNDFDFRGRTFQRDSSARYSVKVTDELWLHRNYHKQLYKAIRKSPLNEKPGYVYSDLSFYLYPLVVQEITGLDFEAYLRRNIYWPLGAYDFNFNPWRYFSPQRIVPTERDTFFRMTLLHGRVHDEGAAMLGGVSGHAGMFTSANDLAKLMQLYLNKGTYGGERLISEAAVEEFTRCQYCDEGIHRGVGFDKPLITYDARRSSVAEAASPDSFGHSGYTGTFTWADPANNLLYIFLSNRVYPSRDSRQIYELNVRPRIHAVLYEAVDGGR